MSWFSVPYVSCLLYDEQMNDMFEEHGAVLSCSPSVPYVSCSCIMNKWTTFVMSMVPCCHVILKVWFVPRTQTQEWGDACHSMTLKTAGYIYILIIYIRDQCDFTIIEDQNNRCCKHKCIHMRYKILEMPRMKSVQTMRFMIWISTKHMENVVLYQCWKQPYSVYI